MRYFLLFGWLPWLLLAAGASPAAAQTLTADWATTCGSGPGSYPYGPASMVLDAQNNLYVAGLLGGPSRFGTTTLSPLPAPGGGPSEDSFLAKLNPQGQYDWAVAFGNSSGAQINQVVISPNGELVLTGRFFGYSLRLGVGGPMLYNSSASYDGFVAVFSAQTGQCRWARRFGSVGEDQSKTLAVSAMGDIYLAGYTGNGGPSDFGPFTLPAAPTRGLNRGFLAKLTTAGQWVWAQQLGSDGDLTPASLVLDTSGAPLLLGAVTSPGVTLGSTFLRVSQVACDGYTPHTDAVLARFTPTGDLTWVVQGDPSGDNNVSPLQLAYDGQGALFAVGAFAGPSARFGGLRLVNGSQVVPSPREAPYPYTCAYYSDAFAARLDATTGAWQWANRQGGAYQDVSRALVLLPNQRLFALYEYMPTITSLAFAVAELDPVTGAWQTPVTLPAQASFAYVNKLQATPQGQVYGGGYFYGPGLTLAGQALTGATGTSTGFVARLSGRPLAATANPTTPAGWQVWPSPGPGTGVWVQGPPAAAGQSLEVYDALGRRVGQGQLPASGGPARLQWPGAGLAPGLYLIRGAAGQACRWVVE